MKALRWIATLAALCVGGIDPAAAQPYPSRAIRFIVPVAAGAGFDVIARAGIQGN